MLVNVEWYDGTHTFQMRRDANVAALKERLAHATGVPRADLSVGTHAGVCSDKSLLRAGEEAAGSESAALPSTTTNDDDATPIEFMAWGRRYSLRRSEEAAHLARNRELAAQRRTKAAVAHTWVALRGYCYALPRRTWLCLIVWLVLGRLAKYVGFGASPSRACLSTQSHHTTPTRAGCRTAGAPFFIASLMYLMYANLGERAAGEASAYTVFNDGMRALPGQLRQEDMERELMHQ